MTAYLLQLPHRADMTDSLRARFRDLTVDRPADAHHVTPVGARFRGARSPGPASQVTVWTVPGARIVGPVRVGEQTLAVYGVVPSPPDAWVDRPVDEEWMIAVARHGGGGCVRVDGPGVDAAGAVAQWVERLAPTLSDDDYFRPVAPPATEFTVYSPTFAEPEQIIPHLHGVGVRVRSAQRGHDGVSLEVVGETQYDGWVSVVMRRITTEPVALASVPWREFGPFAYTVSWRPDVSLVVGVDAADEGASDDALLALARSRIAPLIARLAGRLQAEFSGTVLTADGFVVRGEGALQ